MPTDPENSARTIWFTVGLLSLLFGFAGAVLPLLPTTPFLLLCVYAFARSSPRMHGWLINHPRFGPLIRNWQDHGTIERRTKHFALIIIVLTPVISWISGVPVWLFFVQVVVLAIAATFIMTRPEPE